MSNGIKWDKALAGAAVLAVLYAARSVVTPLLAAFLAAFLMEPWVSRCAKKTGRTGAVAITMTVLAAGFAVVLIFLVPKAVHETVSAAQNVQHHIATMNTTLQRWMTALPEDIKTQAAEAMSAYSGKIVSWGAKALAAGLGFVGGVADALAKGILFLVGFVFLMLDFHLLKPGLLKILSDIGRPAAQVKKIDGFLSESGDVLRSFFRGQLLYALAIGVLSAIGLCAIGLPYGLTIGMATGILSLIPYVGVALGLMVAIAVSFYVNGNILHLILTAGVFGIVQLVDAVYLTPKLLGGSVGIHPLLAVVALLSFSQLFGFFGLMLAIPLAAISLAALRRLLTDSARAA